MPIVKIIRDGQVKLTIPVEVRSDGSIWARSSAGIQPVVSEARMTAAGIAKEQMVRWIKEGRLTEATACALHMGMNPGGTEVVTVEEYEARTAPERAAEAEARKHTRTIYLSSRGWGDYSPVEWTGDLRRPDDEIIAECRRRLDNAGDVDEPLTDEQIAGKVAQARAALRVEQEAARAAADRLAALQAEAKRTGQPQVVRRWMTDRCMNRSTDCSFDSACETIDADGNRKVTYACCY